MPFEIKEGKLINIETGEEAGDDTLSLVKSAYALSDKTEVDAKISGTLKGKLEEARAEYDKLLRDKNATEAEKKKLNDRMKVYESDLLTAKEKAALEHKEKEILLQNKLQELEQENNSLKQAQRDATSRAIIEKAAAKVSAMDPEDFLMHLRSTEEWVSQVDEDGKESVVPRYRVKVFNKKTNQNEDSLVDAFTAAEKLAEDRPYLVQAQVKQGAGIISTFRGTSRTDSIDDLQKRFYRRQ